MAPAPRPTAQRQRGASQLLSLPRELLQKILEPTHKYALRVTCKAFAAAVGAESVLLRRAALASRGARREVDEALTAFPGTRRVVVSLEGAHGARASVDVEETRAAEALLAEAVDALRQRQISSLALLHVSCPLPAHLPATLVELEVADVSYHHATEQGAFNVLIRSSRTILARSDAMVLAALSLPHLRRLSLAAAVFSADGVAALSNLPQLESLSIAGSMECPGGAAQVLATHRSLLNGLSELRHLRLPLAIPSGGASMLVGEDDDDSNDDAILDGHAAAARSAAAHGRAGFVDSDDEEARAAGAPAASSSSGGGRGAVAARRGGGSVLLPPGTMGAMSSSAAELAGAGWVPSFAAAATRGRPAPGAPQQLLQQHKQQAHKLRVRAAGDRGVAGAALAFPRHLQELTIPLCVLNRPIFEAACAAYGSGPAASACHADRAAADSPTPRAQLVPAPSTPPAAAAATLAHGVSGGQRPPAASHSSLRALHIPTLAGYSHWEGSFLTADRDFSLLTGLTGLEVLHINLELGALRRGARNNLRSCFQRLRALRELRELRVTEAQQPTCFTMRKRSCVSRAAHSPFAATAAPTMSSAALAQLQQQWPKLQSLQFFSETVVRSGGRLVVPGWEEVGMLPPMCACCSGPHLVAAPQRSVGRWPLFTARRDE